MKKTLVQACALFVGATAVQAGGIDRSGQGINIIFEEGSAVQFRLGYASPEISGSFTHPLLGETDSGDIAKDFFVPSLAYKKALTEKLDFALMYDQPFGADVEYSKNYALSLHAGDRKDVLRADADLNAITALLRYKFEGGFSALGGLRVQSAEADIGVPAVKGYQVKTDTDVSLGYVVGVAWEKPEIAARVSLTYNSKIKHNWTQAESLNPVDDIIDDSKTKSEIITPQSVNLDFQTGVAPRTLLFGSIRWADWPQLAYAPPVYVGERGKNLVDYQSDTFTYSLGMGYKFSDAFSGAVTLGYEAAKDLPTSNLGPTDGSWSVGLGGTYNVDKAKISGGVRYTEIGDAVTNTGGVFTDNSAWSVGLQVTYALN